MRVEVDAERLERAEVELLRVARVGLEDDLELRVRLQPVRVLAVAAVIRAHGGLDVRDVPRLGPEHAHDGVGVHRPRTDLGVVGLHDHASAVGPVLLQRQQGILHRQHVGHAPQVTECARAPPIRPDHGVTADDDGARAARERGRSS